MVDLDHALLGGRGPAADHGIGGASGGRTGASATATLWAIRAAAISIRLMGISILLESERAVFALFRFVPELSELANHIMHQNYVDV
jgi:hypothetical protein